jgi:hypothetical protein
MDKITKISGNGLSAYFDILSKYGAVNKDIENKLLALILIDDFLHGSLMVYSTESDLRYLEQYIHCLISSNCLTPIIDMCGPLYLNTNQGVLDNDIIFLLSEDSEQLSVD